MISNKEKRLSHAAPTLSNNDGFNFASDAIIVNHIKPPNYGLNNNNTNHHSNVPINHMNVPMKDPHLKKLVQEQRNSHSLNHDFSQLYISNLKNQIESHTTSSGVKHRAIDPNRGFEEMNSYKKEALESKKQMFQMEKSISFWSDCTEYWRNKWRITRDEKNKLRDEVKQLRSRMNKLEHQLKTSEEKRIRLGNEVNFLNEELSRYMYRYEDDTAVNNRKKPTTHNPIQYNSDRRVDYRKKHRRKIHNLIAKSSTNQTTIPPNIESSSSDSENQHHHNAQSHHSYTMVQPQQQHQQKKHYDIDQIHSLGKFSSNSKIVFRHHERLFDKRIMNKKRFSQVVMLDEDEIFQMNKDFPLASSLSKTNATTNDDCDTLKISHSSSIMQQSELNDTLNTFTNSHKHRYMDYLPEDVEEEDSFDDRIKPGQFFSDDLDFESTGLGSSTTNIVASTNNIATNNNNTSESIAKVHDDSISQDEGNGEEKTDNNNNNDDDEKKSNETFENGNNDDDDDDEV